MKVSHFFVNDIVRILDGLDSRLVGTSEVGYDWAGGPCDICLDRHLSTWRPFVLPREGFQPDPVVGE